jgi:hypothetical protein
MKEEERGGEGEGERLRLTLACCIYKCNNVLECHMTSRNQNLIFFKEV